MVQKQKPTVRIDIELVANDTGFVSSRFTEKSGTALHPHILDIAGALGRQAARAFMKQAANDNHARKKKINPKDPL